MPVFSLPDSSGIGDLGPAAYHFVDFLQSAGQGIWQLLPMGPSARGNSPYSSYSAFAGSPLFISAQGLVEVGLLSESDARNSDAQADGDYVDYPSVRKARKAMLRKAFGNFQAGNHSQQQPFDEFCSTNSDWLEDFVLYEAIAEERDDFDWSHWEADLIGRQEAAMQAAQERLAGEMLFSRFEQFVFHQQWSSLKQYANERGIRIYGDMPIFVAFESADVWANQHLYQLGEDGRPLVVAGVPPDYFSETGQMWGNPLYAWDRHADSGFEWWIRRLKQALESFDLLRLDHFRGFESYWEIPADAENATSGQWKPAPGDALFGAVREALGDVPIVAEDLGLITDEVHHLRDRLGFPGMRVLQFGFEHHDDAYHRPEAYPEGSVAYTGTHDNETIMGWYRRRLEAGISQDLISPLLSGDPGQVHLDLIRAVMNSAAHTVIIPIQDLLGLGNKARVNIPGKADGNWAWRCANGALNPELANVLQNITKAANRS